MFWTLLLPIVTAAAPQRMVAIGGGLVAGPPADLEPETAPANWVNILEDCLRDSQPGQWDVSDRTRQGETARSALERMPEVLELAPARVLVGVGARELTEAEADPERFATDLQQLITSLRAAEAPPRILLLGVVPPLLTQTSGGDPFDQAALDDRVSSWNAALVTVAADTEGVDHLDLWTSWPRQRAPRAELTVGGWHLSAQGHAHVASAACQALAPANVKDPAP